MSTEKESCGVPEACARAVPGWLVLLDNVPTLAMYLLGAAILWPLGIGWAAAYLLYSAVSIVLFWKCICPYCHHYGTRACPCGYGVVSARLFRSKRDAGEDFRSVFRDNIGVVFPSWFVPPAVGLCLLWWEFTPARLWLLVAFCVVGFALIPLISKLVGCRNCSVREDCPWMKPA